MNYFAGLHSEEEKKKRYRELAKKHHPDAVGGNAETFKEINRQYRDGSDSRAHNAGFGGASSENTADIFEGVDFSFINFAFGFIRDGMKADRREKKQGRDFAAWYKDFKRTISQDNDAIDEFIDQTTAEANQRAGTRRYTNDEVEEKFKAAMQYFVNDVFS